MLTFMRRLAGTWVARGLFILLVLSFAIWGIGDVVRNFGRDTAVARVGGQPIEIEEAQMAARREMARLSRQLGARFQPDENIRRAVAASALEALITDRALRVEAQREGVTVPEDAVRNLVFSIPGLQQGGQFSRVLFDAFLRQNELTEPGFLALVRADLARVQLVGAVRAGAAAPDAVTKPLLAWQSERRIADVALFPLVDAPDPPAPTEAQLRRYQENNPERFSSPEYREVTLAVLSPETMARDIEISDADIAAAFEQRRGQFETPERRAIQQAVLPTEEAAKTLAEAWRGGADWAAIQRQAQEAGGQTTTLPPTDRDGMPFPTLAEAAFATPQGQVADPVQTPFGWHVIRVESVEPATSRTLEQARDELRRDLAQDRALDLAYERSNRIEDALAGGTPLAEAAQRFGMMLTTIRLDASGRTPEGSEAQLPVPQANRNDLLRAIFAARQGDHARLQEVGDAFIAIDVKEVIPPALRPFESVEAQVRSAYVNQERRRAMESRAAAMLAAVQGGKPWAEAAQEVQAQTERLGPFGREPSQDMPIPPELLAPLFEARVGNATMVETRGGFAVAQLAEIVRANPDADPLGLGRVRGEVEQQMTDDLDAQYQQALRARADVRINRSLLETVAGQ